MITTETDATIKLEVAEGKSGAKYALLTVENHAGRIVVALDRDQVRTHVGDSVEVWAELGQSS
ncbi:hypothetical protein [Nocardia xishanensis]|uniref:hypothetical protein n=1 Tax=Nocardia xishanensis TaxID=238964 RepID=UPI000836D7E4|nr:hypothetical protein [Nocardia xishanensis]